MMMEASSPLAAMQPPTFMSRCGFGQDALSYASFARRNNLVVDNFNFKDLSMRRRPQPDYFSMPPPVRGSSPTASLAADLSQNMNIDKRYEDDTNGGVSNTKVENSSPQYPTPRRALFSGNLFSTHG